ncbi:NACHT and WD40 repeat domain-containing protein [Nocardia alni]|uniref:NACHT and WD40 repeat domain-containing protein n=1 Tax=Nocardia alni TaxID=2815723 RepID=UPI001C2212B4|nr:NACHT domain-containing protein [Nocardia alni]
MGEPDAPDLPGHSEVPTHQRVTASGHAQVNQAGRDLTITEISLFNRRSSVTDAVVDLRRMVAERERTASQQLLGGGGQADRAIDVQFEYIRARSQAAVGAAREGTLAEVVDYFRRLQPRRMVITGPGGSGKTVLAIKLISRLIGDDSAGEAVPVRLSASSLDIVSNGQNPESEWLQDWLILHLHQVYGLSMKSSRSLVQARMVLPVVDGLDEVDADERPGLTSRAAQIIVACNAFLERDGDSKASVILTCRDDQYQALEQAGEWMLDSARIQLQPVTVDAAEAFLARRARNPESWEPVVAAMRHSSGPIATALATPWRLTLAATVYEPVNRVSGPRRYPNELLDDSLDTPDKIRDHLLGLLIPAAEELYRDHRHPDRYSADRVSRGLSVLADYLEHNLPTRTRPARILHGRVLSGTDIVLHDLWPLSGFVAPRVVVSALKLFVWFPLFIWIAQKFIVPVSLSPAVWLIILVCIPPIVLGDIANIFVEPERPGGGLWPIPSRARLFTHLPIRRSRLRFALVFVLAAALGVIAWRLTLVGAIVISLTVALSAIFRKLEPGDNLRGKPGNIVLWSFITWPLTGIFVGTACLIIAEFVNIPLGHDGRDPRLAFLALPMLIAYLPATLYMTRFHNIGWYYVALLVLTRRSRIWLPWQLDRFLQWCYGAGLLRLAGPGYQFRHRELQEYFAREADRRVSNRQASTLSPQVRYDSVSTIRKALQNVSRAIAIATVAVICGSALANGSAPLPIIGLVVATVALMETLDTASTVRGLARFAQVTMLITCAAGGGWFAMSHHCITRRELGIASAAVASVAVSVTVMRARARIPSNIRLLAVGNASRDPSVVTAGAGVIISATVSVAALAFNTGGWALLCNVYWGGYFTIRPLAKIYLHGNPGERATAPTGVSTTLQNTPIRPRSRNLFPRTLPVLPTASYGRAPAPSKISKTVNVCTGWVNDIKALSFSTDWRLLATASTFGSVRLWDPITCLPVCKEPLAGHSKLISTVAFRHDGYLLAVGAQDGTVQVWDTDTGTPISSPVGNSIKSGTGRLPVVFSPDGYLLAAASWDRTVRLWDVTTGMQVCRQLTEHTSRVVSMAFNPNGTMLATAGYDGTVRLWDPDTGEPIGHPLIGHRTGHTGDWVTLVTFSPDGRLLATAGGDRTVRLWSTATGTQVGNALTGHPRLAAPVVFSPDSRLLATSCDDRTVRLWNTTTTAPVGQPLTGHTKWIDAITFRADGHLLATASWDRTVRLWNTATYTLVGEPLTGHSRLNLPVTFSRDGRMLAIADNKKIRLWH